MVISIIHIPNALTAIRIVISIVLLFTEPLSSLFYACYLVCGATDMLDGYIARKTSSTSKSGAILDSAADFIFVIIMLFIMVPIIDVPFWALFWLIGITAIKTSSLVTGFMKYRSLAFLHTYMNKASGALLFTFPLLYDRLGITMTAYILCSMATIAALEELAINLTSEKLSHNRKSIFSK
ncbi:CDP-alcohol phosphatidyltransferase family protein [Bacillaceae bacterium Marseille-Q3522]|nr:CDP-alcohol phosphatidyltransferase family protein [Bacillaceae bacterium Marseille-Q3522]